MNFLFREMIMFEKKIAEINYRRWYTATMVLQGLLANCASSENFDPNDFVRAALRTTDALLEKLNEKTIKDFEPDDINKKE